MECLGMTVLFLLQHLRKDKEVLVLRHKPVTGLTMLCALSFAFGWGCVTQEKAIKVKNALPPEKVAYFSDSFDSLRQGLWEKVGMVYSEKQLENFKLAEPRIQDGEVVVQTEVGGFSKGGLASKFILQGDFDIQLDCHMDFPEDLQQMDWITVFGVFEVGGTIGDTTGAQISMVRKMLTMKNLLGSSYIERGTLHRGAFTRIADFDGTLRLVRKGDRITALYRLQGEPEWSELGTHPFTNKDAFVGFKVQNFLASRKVIQALSSVSAAFDEFRINAAEGIVESEI